MRASIAGWIRRLHNGARPSAGATRVRAIRGAIDLPIDDAIAIRDAVSVLIATLMQRNALVHDEIISAFFTATPDITSLFPALAAREADWGAVPMLCATEIHVPGSLPRCIRVMVHVELPAYRTVEHVYLGGAAALRPDLAGAVPRRARADAPSAVRGSSPGSIRAAAGAGQQAPLPPDPIPLG